MEARDEKLWKALAEPTRRRILDELREGPKTTGALCAPFEQSRFGVMKHLDALETAGLILVERRGRERWNHLNGVAMHRAIDRWLSPFQREWSGRLSSLQDFLGEGGDMSDTRLMEVRQELELPAAADRVFRALTRDIGRWWTNPFRQAGAGSRLELEAGIGAAMIERGPEGHDVIWGRIEEIAPPTKLYLSGRFAVMGAVAGRVHFDLTPLSVASCRLAVVHLAIGAIAAETRDTFAEGWRELLDHRLRSHLDEVHD